MFCKPMYKANIFSSDSKAKKMFNLPLARIQSEKGFVQIPCDPESKAGKICPRGGCEQGTLEPGKLVQQPQSTQLKLLQQ